MVDREFRKREIVTMPDNSENTPVITEESYETITNKRYSFHNDCNFLGHIKDYRELRTKVMERVNELIEKINDVLSKQQQKIKEFTIGKTFAPKKKNGKGWKVKGIRDRWSTYETKGYTFLLAFAVLTKENLSESILEPFNNQQMLALGLENHLIQHFCFLECDSRLGNESLDPGKKNQGYAGQVLYIAVKVSNQTDEEDD